MLGVSMASPIGKESSIRIPRKVGAELVVCGATVDPMIPGLLPSSFVSVKPRLYSRAGSIAA
jgi:hypothetical protein